nr:MAG TPA: hypothetical protein [Caudoviricetes sp.]
MSIRDEIHLLKHENVYLSRTLADLKLLVIGLSLCLLVAVIFVVKIEDDRNHQIKDLRSQITDNRDSMRNNAIRISYLEQDDKLIRERVGLNNE